MFLTTPTSTITTPPPTPPEATTQDRTDIQTGRRICGTAAHQPAQKLAAKPATDDTGNRIAQRAQALVLENTTGDIAANSTRYKLNNKLFHNPPFREEAVAPEGASLSPTPVPFYPSTRLD